MGVDLLAQSGQCYKLVMNDLTDVQFEAGTFSSWPGFGLEHSSTSATVLDATRNNDASDDRTYLQDGPLFKILLEVLPQVYENR